MIMDSSHIEAEVQKKTNKASYVLSYALIALFVISLLLFFLFSFSVPGLLSLILAIATGIGGFITFQRLHTDFEYEYLDGELRIARIFNRSRRKAAGAYQVENIEILAPYAAHRVDYLRKNKRGKVLDFSSGEERKPDPRYLMAMNDGTQLILEPDERILNAIRQKAPRKVFFD